MTLVLLGSLLLAAVFATAGVAKLRDLSGSREAMEGFGVPTRLVAPLGVAVPLAELVVAVALLVGPATTGGALGALTLLAGFSLAIAGNLARGRTPDCHCFGQLHSSPAGPRTLARNAGLIALAGFVASQADPVWSAIAASGGFVLAGAGWVLSLRAKPAGDKATVEGLALGTPAPSFALPRLDGQLVDLESLLQPGRRTLLVFSDPDCGPCQALAPEVANWQRRYPGELTIAVIESLRDRSEQPDSDRDGRRNVLLQEQTEVAEAYRAHGTPTAVLIGADGQIASSVAGGARAIESLVAESVDRFEPQPATAVAERWTRPLRIGGPLIRRELLVRGAAAGAAVGMVLAWPRQAVGMRRGGRRRCSPYRDRCGNRCCQRGEICNNPDDGVCIDVCENHRTPDSCRGDCTNFDNDPRNCGGCGRPPCPDGTVCAGGNCVSGNSSACGDTCGDDLICCQGTCVHPELGRQNCGGCGIVCSGDRPRCCFGRCADLDSDFFNCGGCLNRCLRGQVCHNGRCRDECPQGLRQCGRTCGQPSTQACCGGQLIDREDMQSDVENCGSCGCRCVGRQECTCQNGECLCPGPLDGSCAFSP